MRSLRILLDECLPKDLRASLSPHNCTSVVDFGYLPGREKESLLAFGDGIFDVFITFNLPDAERRKLFGYRTAVVMLSAKSNRLSDLRLLGPKILLALRTIEAGHVVHVADSAIPRQRPTTSSTLQGARP
jgi:hypothetical protein